MTLPCPVCKVENAQGPSCRRCKADLSTLFQLEALRDQLLAAGRWHLARGESLRAAERFLVAQRQRDGEEVQLNLALAALLHRDFAAAWNYWREATGGQKPA